MKKEYDFSKAERGKFFRKDITINLPVYLDDEVRSFVTGIAKKKHSDLNRVVNDLLRSDIGLAHAMS